MPATLHIERTGPTWKAIVRHAAGTDASYQHPTREAAQASGERMLARVPTVAEPTGQQRIVRLVPVGRAAR